jgi:hypothetical protein
MRFGGGCCVCAWRMKNCRAFIATFFRALVFLFFLFKKVKILINNSKYKIHIKMDNHVATKSEKHILKLFYQNNKLLPHSKEFGAF